jgi:hypothetical protein
MRYFILSLVLLISIFNFAQVKDISPSLSTDEVFYGLSADSQGNLYTVKNKNYTGTALIRYQNGAWEEVMGYPDKPVDVCVVDDKVYLLTHVPLSSYHYQLHYLSASGWVSIPVSSLNASVTNVMMLPGKQLVVKGSFKKAGAAYYFAKWNNGQWEPMPLPPDQDILNILASSTSFEPVADEKGVLYFYTFWGGSTPGNEVISWDGTNWKKMGLFGKYKVNKIEVAPNGNVYAANNTSGIVEWNGKEWNLLQCNAKGYDGGIFKAVAINENNEVFVAGESRKKKDFLVYKYSNGTWQEFARIPQGPLSSLYYNNGNLYAGSDDFRLYLITGAGKPNEKKDITVISNASYSDSDKEMWKIYDDYSAHIGSIWQRATDVVRFFSGSYADDEKTLSIARSGIQDMEELNKLLKEYKVRISQLDLGSKHDLYNSVLAYLDAAIKHNNTWGTLFSCFTKDDDACVDATQKELRELVKDMGNKTDRMQQAAAQYRKEKNIQ